VFPECECKGRAFSVNGKAFCCFFSCEGGKTEEKGLLFSFVGIYSYLWLLPKVLSLGKGKKKGFSFPFVLAYSYFGFRRRYFRSAKERKRGFPFRLCSLIRTFVPDFKDNSKKRLYDEEFFCVCGQMLGR